MFRSRAPRGLWFVVAVAVLATPAFARGKKGGRGGGAAPHGASAAPASSRRAPVDVKLTGGEPAPDAQAAPSQGGGSGGPPSRGPTRIDFDDRLIQGQTNKSGAVYLYDRKELKQRSMVKVRESFRQEIVGSIYDR